MNTIIRPYKEKLIDREFITNITLYDMWVLCNRYKPLYKVDTVFKKFFIGIGTITIFGNTFEEASLTLVATCSSTMVLDALNSMYTYSMMDNESRSHLKIYVSIKDLINYKHFINSIKISYDRYLCEDRLYKLAGQIFGSELAWD